MKKTVLLAIVLFLYIQPAVSQELPKVIPPSPNAASLGEYGKIPVGLFTGTPQVNISIYEFKQGGLSVPISLSYSSNGIRVDQIASNVGLGWNLNAGGVITRVVMDDADESQIATLPNNFPGEGTQETLDYLRNASNSQDGYDTLSDIYSFNFNGYTGKFFLDENRLPVLINPSPLKIEKTPNSTFAFKITDSNGTVFWFGNDASTETTMYRSIGGGHSTWTLENASSWYLSKIESNTGQVINFNYTNFHKTYYAGLSQSIFSLTTGNNIYPGQGLVFSEVKTRFAQLSSIISNVRKVNFSYTTNSTEFNKLDIIEIKDSTDKLIKKYKLEYDIVNSTLLNLKNPHITHADRYEKRLFLSSVTEINSQNVYNKPYLLSYYSPDKIPPMFSYATDYWGFYNGVTTNLFLVSEDDYFLGSPLNTTLLSNIFSNVKGNKKPNGIFGINGMLKKIIYPTSGYNEFLYEPHSYYGTETIYPSRANIAINIYSDEGEFGSNTEIVTTERIPFQQLKTPLYFSVGRSPCWEDGWPTHHIRGVLSVKVAEIGSDIFQTENILYNISTAGETVGYTSSINITENYGSGQFYMDLLEGKKYQFSFGVQFECIRGDFRVPYYDQSPNEIETNIEVGGLRLDKVISENGEGKEEVKNYHYGNLSCLECSSGIVEDPIPAITFTRHHEVVSYFQGQYKYHVSDRLTLSSSNLYNLYTKQGSHIGYESVIEEFGDNFEAGGVLHKYNIPLTINSNPISGFIVAGTPFTNNFGTGQETEKQIFKKVGNDYITTQQVINNYTTNSVLDLQRSFYNVHLRETYSNMSFTILDQIYFYDVTEHYKRSQWHYLDQKIEKQYDTNGLNPITTTINYFYENTNHLQSTKVETLNSKGELITSKTDYPQDLQNPSLAEQTLIAQHRIATPIQTETTLSDLDGTVLSKNTLRTNYKDFGNNLILPENIQTSKGLNSLEPRIRIIYYDYDDYGNPLEVSKADGTHIVYIWGYNHTQPIAKIENATYADVQSQVTNLLLQTLSNADNDRTIDTINQNGSITPVGKEGDLRAALTILRASLPESQVTTYTYDPLIGVTSIADPRGNTIYYEYDPFNRLKHVKDKDGNILSQNEYNYKN